MLGNICKDGFFRCLQVGNMDKDRLVGYQVVGQLAQDAGHHGQVLQVVVGLEQGVALQHGGEIEKRGTKMQILRRGENKNLRNI